MLLKRFLCALFALTGALLPGVVSWLVLVIVLDHRWAVVDSRGAPNPARAPVWMLGPAAVLVYVDPYFAGTLYLWLAPGAVLLVGIVLWAAGLPVLRKEMSLAPACPSITRLVLVSTAMGLFLAAPWIYALVRVLSGDV